MTEANFKYLSTRIYCMFHNELPIIILYEKKKKSDKIIKISNKKMQIKSIKRVIEINFKEVV